jgi:crotonobetainyl-CoA:carnitine CoA-transferase CaiB-like acyl-CoA transferase
VVALTGAHAAVAALGALRWTRRCAQGVRIEVSALDVLASCLGDALPATLCARPGRATPSADHRALVLPCADGYVQITAPTPIDRRSLAALTGVDALADPDRDAAPLLDDWLRSRTRAEVVDEAQLWRLPVTPVLAPGEPLSPDEPLSDEPSEAAGGCVADRSPFHYRAGPMGAPAPRPRGHSMTPLGDVRVLDFGTMWAGPYAGRLLADLGAEVIKVEGPNRPDGTRSAASANCRGMFADLNWGKAGLALDLADPAGCEAVLGLARQVDAVLDNFSPRVMPNLGLDEATLWKANPRLVGVSLPAFGRGGQWANYVAYGGGIEAVAGLAARSTGPPRLSAIPYTDFLAGCYGAAALLATLLRRDRDGRGGWLEVPQYEVARDVLGAAPRGDGLAEPSWDAAKFLADPHLGTRGLFNRRQRSSCPGRHVTRPPFLLHGIPTTRHRPAPAFGADTRRLLVRLAGLTPAEVDRMMMRGAGDLVD